MESIDGIPIEKVWSRENSLQIAQDVNGKLFIQVYNNWNQNADCYKLIPVTLKQIKDLIKTGLPEIF